MYVHKFEETRLEADTGNRLLVPRQMTETIEAGLVSKKKGEKTPLASHPDEEEIYVFLGGKARLRIGEEVREVGPDTVAYVPRNTLHQVEALGDEGVQYVYLANWPKP